MTRNIIPIFFGLLFVAFTACNSSGESYRLTGDLCFPWLRLSSFYNQPDSVFQYYRERRSTITTEQLIAEDSAGASYLLMLENNNLLTSPYVFVRTSNGSIVTVFMKMADYDSFKEYDYSQLRASNKKVQMKLTVKVLTEGVYLCEEVHRVDLIPGETTPEPGRFNIENYH